MIAPVENRVHGGPRLTFDPATLREKEEGFVHRVVTEHPKSAMSIALATGMVLGWFVKRGIR